MKKSSSASSQRNIPILEKICQIKAEHPFLGYRRIWAHLNFIDHILVNKKRVFRLMKEHHFLVKKDLKLKAKRASNKPKPQAERPDQIYGIDMTKILLTEEGWAYLVLVID